MPPNILSSHLVTIPVLDALLSSSTSPPNLTKKVQLLSTKLAILTNRPSQPARGQPFDVEIQILRCRLDLAAAHLALAAGSDPNASAIVARSGGAGGELKLAEMELGLVEKECKGIIKRYSRLVKLERDKAESRSLQNLIDAEAGSPDTSLSTSTSKTPPTSSASASPNGLSGSTPDMDLTTHMAEMNLSDPTRTPGSGTGTVMTPSSSSSTPTTPGTPLTPSTSDTPDGLTKRQKRLKLISEIRIEGLKLSITSEDRLGRGDKKARLEGLVHKLEAG